MRAIIAGGTGFIGRALVAELSQNGWDVVVVSRNPDKVGSLLGRGVTGLSWEKEGWSELLDSETVIVNLAGENIAGERWSQTQKQRILDSRVQAGERLLKIVQESKNRPKAFIQGSAVGYYGYNSDVAVDESAPIGKGFLANVCREWEATTQPLEAMGIRRAVIRTGMVLGNGGGLEKMLLPFKSYVGGPPGSGHQVVSWIHIADQVGAIRFLMENEGLCGTFNLTAPNPVTFLQFAKTLGETLDRPYKMHAPAFALRLLFGDMADEILLGGQRALPQRLLEAGYHFKFDLLRAALTDILV